MEQSNILNQLPAIPIRGIAPIPHTEVRIEIGREISIKAAELSENKYNNTVILLIQKNPLKEEVDLDNLLPVGILAHITLRLRLPNNNYKLRLMPLERVDIKEYITQEPYILVSYDKLKSKKGNPEEEMILIKMLNEHFQGIKNIPDDIVKHLKSGASADKLSDLIAASINVPFEYKVRYLSELDVNNRLRYILEDLNHEEQILEIENKINEAVKHSIDENQKEYYLREKLRAIQNELGDKARKEEEIEAMRETIKNAQMPEHILKKALQELQRFQDTPAQMAESQILKNYLDFLIGLPWNKASIDNNDLNLVTDALNKNHYGLDKVKDRIIEYLAVKIMTNRNPQTILCLVGPPGVGKTSLAISIAQALGRKFIKQSLGGIKDESEIRGHRRTYIGALPGRILKGMFDAKTVNPVFLLDEIDKMASDYKGDPASAMLEVLDPEQNSQFSDHYLEEAYDLSQVLFITTANYLEDIPAPLRDRMEVVELNSYTEFEKFNIAKKHLLPKQLNDHGISDKQFLITDEAIYYIIRRYTREAGVRELSRYFGTLIRKTIKAILTLKVESITITLDNVEKYLSKPKYNHNSILEIDQIGIVTGLAYTQFGGDTLDVEATFFKGKGGLVLTGKLGEVMKESAQAALSFVKSNANTFNIDSKVFEENDIHVHVPEGAVPKDGPSAGVTITTAIVSALTGKKVRRDLGMTGEITLRGDVLPIGGLREKSIAALRSGLNTILIPKDNLVDVEDIPQEVKDSLKIIPVKNVLEVIQQAIKS